MILSQISNRRWNLFHKCYQLVYVLADCGCEKQWFDSKDGKCKIKDARYHSAGYKDDQVRFRGTYYVESSPSRPDHTIHDFRLVQEIARMQV